MNVIDLSHTIHPQMPFFPGTEPPLIEQANTLEKDGFIENKLTLYSHTGTHIDAPAHLLQDGLTVDQFKVEHFLGQALLIEVMDLTTDFISKEVLLKYEHQLNNVDFVILKTGWDKHWETQDYYQGFPSLTKEAAQWLASYPLKGVGIDTISIDAMDSATFSIHHVFLRKNMLVIENLTNLDLITTQQFIFSCLPLRLKEGDGSPVRAVAVI